MIELARLTWQEAEAAFARAHLAIVPVGSCEQHGPHLTLSTDIEIAEGLARRLAEDLGDEAILCPAFPFGLSEHHMAFAGTLTLSPESFLGVLMDLLDSLQHHGLRRSLFVNGHGGNIDALKLVSRKARRRGLITGSVMWSQLAADYIASKVSSDKYGHACEVETSVAMELAPACLRPERIGPPGERSAPEPLTDPPRGRVDRAIWFEEWTSDGALGDPRKASEQFGREIVAHAYEDALAFARDLAKAEPRRSTGRS